MGLKHDMKLAAISGVNGVFSDEDIAKVRDLALEARNQMGKKTIDAPHSRHVSRKKIDDPPEGTEKLITLKKCNRKKVGFKRQSKTLHHIV
ncbi:MAG: hypothetical protein R2874_16230 [Desulfobacterales bacterium]